eukprot:851818_1
MAKQIEPEVSPLAVFQSAVYGNDALKLTEKKEIEKQIDITDRITVRDDCGEVNSTYVIDNMYNDDKDTLWGADGSQDIWIIFDTHGHQINQIKMDFFEFKDEEGSTKYGCKTIHVSDSDDLQQTFQLIIDHQCVDNDLNHHEITLHHKTKRLLKLQFSDLVNKRDIFGLQRIRFYGSLATGTGHQTDDVLYPWEELKDQNDESFEEDDNAQDITQSHLLQLVKTFPSDLKGSSNMSCGEHSERQNRKKDAFLIYDVGKILIDSIDIELDTTMMVKISTCDGTSDGDWNMIRIKREVVAKQRYKFYLKSTHGTRIKIAISNRKISAFKITHLQFNGFEPVVQDEITDQIKLFQCSRSRTRGQTAEFILNKNNNKSWLSAKNYPSTHLIFDCGRYEVHRIFIQFDTHSKPQWLKLRLSDVPNRYAFKTPSAQKWKFKTSLLSWDDRTWDDINECEEVTLNDLYKDGFKRYLQLEFLEYMRETLGIVRIRFYGAFSEQIPKDSEQFDAILDSIHDEVETKEDDDTCTQYAPKAVVTAPTATNTPVDAILNTNTPYIRVMFSRDKVAEPYFVVDCGNNAIRKIIVSISSSNTCKICKISTGDKMKGKKKEWTLLFENNEMNLNAPSDTIFEFTNETQQRYLKFEFLEYNRDIRYQSLDVNKILLIGESKHLYHEEKAITMDDILRCEHVDEDLIHKFQNQENEKLRNIELRLANEECEFGEQFRKTEITDTKWNEWIEMGFKYETVRSQPHYKNVEYKALLQPTIFERDEMMKLAEIYKDITHKYTKLRVDVKRDTWQTMFNADRHHRVVEEETQQARKEYQELSKLYSNEPTNTELQNSVNKLSKLREKETECRKEFDKQNAECRGNVHKLYPLEHQERQRIFEDTLNETIYNQWKDSVEQNPLIISDKYNVTQYESMIRWAQSGKRAEIRVLWTKLAALFQQSIKESKPLIHKYHVFQLSLFGREFLSRKFGLSGANTADIWVLFDCETIKLEYIQFQTESLVFFNKVLVSTSNELLMAKPKHGDEDEKEIKWNNFNVIAQREYKLYNDDDKKELKDGITFEQSRIDVQGKNQRYLKLIFTDFLDPQYIPNIVIQSIKFYATSKQTDDEECTDVTEGIKVADSAKCHQGRNADNLLHGYEGFHVKPGYMDGAAFIANEIRDAVCCTLNKLRNGGRIATHEKHFIKFLLCWVGGTHYKEILLTAKRVMNILSKPLTEEYKRLQQADSKILTLALNKDDRLEAHITSNHALLEWDYSRWYTYRKAMFYPKDLKPLAEEWIKLGLNLKDVEFKQIRRNGIIDKEVSFTSADEVAMEYINLIAFKLNPSFQRTMKRLFEQNRRKLDLRYPTNDANLGVLSGPVKTKSRQNIKVKLDYFNTPSPQCLSVLDIVRCAIVCESADELCTLFELINVTFSGKILRVKNAFDDPNKGACQYGYRAILMNIAYGDPNVLPKGYELIVEVQLLLFKYYTVRKNMHLGYGIVRSEEGGVSQQKKPHYVLAQDSCKLGKLDI